MGFFNNINAIIPDYTDWFTNPNWYDVNVYNDAERPYIEIGEVFKIHDKYYQCVKWEINDIHHDVRCKECAGTKLKPFNCPKCNEHGRKDGHDVIFQEIKK